MDSKLLGDANFLRLGNAIACAALPVELCIAALPLPAAHVGSRCNPASSALKLIRKTSLDKRRIVVDLINYIS